jgi:hypothetical protein
VKICNSKSFVYITWDEVPSRYVSVINVGIAMPSFLSKC